MDSGRATLAIYGIQDRYNYKHPFYVHDHNLAIMQEGQIRDFLQLERTSRNKCDNKLHEQLYGILKTGKLLTEEFDLIFVDNVVGRTFLTSKGDARFEAPLNNVLATNFEPGRCWWFGKEQKAWVLNHELAHVFSCLPFFGNFKDNSLLVHFDGGASLSNFSAWTFKNNTLKLVEYHWKLKRLTGIFNANALVFAIIGAKLTEQNSVPGKVMGFAGYGTFDSKLEEWLNKHNYFENIWCQKSIFFQEANREFGIQLSSFDQQNTFIQDVVATLHHVFVRETLAVLNELQQRTNCENLYYTGGCALNIVANTEIVNSRIFDEVFIPPCTEDSGLALGAAAYAEWKKHDNIKIHSPYLNSWNIDNNEFQYSDKDIQACADELYKGKIIGICNGYGEVGPRALGNRSLLCLANSKQLAQKLSMQHKGREWYRPLAPIMLAENTKYFTGLDKINQLSKFMLLDFNILPTKRKEIEGVVHENGSARIQSVFGKKDNPFIWDVLMYLQETYNVKALINTSFNSKAEPIVHTAFDALNSARKMNIDGLVINSKLRMLR